MKKVLSLVLAFAMIITVMPFGVHAADPYEEAGNFLKGLGVIKGADQGNLNSMSNLTREESIVILTRMMGLEQQALAANRISGFNDVPEAHWASSYIAYARQAGWTNGISSTEFGIKQNVTTKQFVTFMLRALNHTADWSKENIMQKSRQLGLLKDVSAIENDAVIRGEVFIIMKNALDAKLNGSNETLMQKLGLAPKAPDTPTPGDMSVVSVKATNLKQIEVEFNSKVDASTLTSSAFKILGTSLGALSPKLKGDNIVVLTVNNVMSNRKNYKLEISKIKNASGAEVTKATHEFEALDTTLPEIKGVKVTGPKSIQLEFSEPIKVTGTIKLLIEGKNGPSANVIGFSAGTTVIDVNASSNFNDGKTYTARIDGFQDFSAYSNLSVDVDFNYENIKSAPNASIVAATSEYIEVEFDRPVKNLTLKNFYHSYPSWTAVAAYESLETMNKSLSNKLTDAQLKTSRNKVVLRFVNDIQNFIKNSPAGEHPLSPGKIMVYVKGKIGTLSVVDHWGNQLADLSQEVTISGEKAELQVISVSAINEKEIEIDFSHDIVFNKSDYKLLSTSGGSISGLSTNITQDGNKKVKIEVKSPKMTGKSVKVRIGTVHAATLGGGKVDGPQDFDINFGDSSFNGMKEAAFIAGDGNSDARVRVKFAEAVDASSATNADNYKFKVSGAIKPVGFSINSISDDTIEISVIKEEWKKLDGSVATNHVPAYLQISMSNAVTDKAGNKMGIFEQNLDINAIALVPNIVSVHAKSNDVIEVKFDTEMMIEGGWELDKFNFTGTLAGKKVKDVTEKLDSGNTVLTVAMEDANALAGYTSGGFIEYNGSKKPKNTLETEFTWNVKAVSDKNAPNVAIFPEDKSNAMYTLFTPHIKSPHTVNDVTAGAYAIMTYKSGSDRYIVINYNEAIDSASISNTSYKFSTSNVEILNFASVGETVSLKVKVNTPLTSDEIADFGVTQVGSIKDTNGNIKIGNSVEMKIQNIFTTGLE